jgi:hypothetical protein
MDESASVGSLEETDMCLKDLLKRRLQWARLWYYDEEKLLESGNRDLPPGPLGQFRVIISMVKRLLSGNTEGFPMSGVGEGREWQEERLRFKLSTDGQLDICFGHLPLLGLPSPVSLIPIGPDVNRFGSCSMVCGLGFLECLAGKMAWVCGSPFAKPVMCQNGDEIHCICHFMRLAADMQRMDPSLDVLNLRRRLNICSKCGVPLTDTKDMCGFKVRQLFFQAFALLG